MKETTRKRKKAMLGFKEAVGRQWIVEQMYRILESGKQGFDSMLRKTLHSTNPIESMFSTVRDGGG